MAISTTTLGLLTTAALLSVFRLPSLIKDRSREVSGDEYHKRFGSVFYARPTRGPLDRFVNRIFRRPYLADVPSPLYRRLYNQRWNPLLRGNTAMFTAESNPALSYHFGYPTQFDRKTTRNSFTGTTRTSLRNYFDNYAKPTGSSGRDPGKSEHYPHDLEGDDTVDVHHYYHYDDVHPIEESLDMETNFGEEGASSNEELKGHSLNMNKKPSDLFKPHQSKSGYSYSQNRQALKPRLTTFKPEYTTKDCSPKVNYHYHMYFTNQKNDSKISGKKKSGKYKTTSSTTMQSPTEAVYHSGDHDQETSKESDTDYVYQVYTNTNMDSAVYPMIEVPSNIRKEKKKKIHFDSDYYNRVLMSKVFGLGDNTKVMPMENYKTENPVRMAYRNPSGMDTSDTFKKDQNSKPYVTMEAKPGIKTSTHGMARGEIGAKSHLHATG